MDFLEYGINNKNSKSSVRRAIAGGVLAVEKKRADLYEAWLNKKPLPFEDDPEETAALFLKICKAVNDQEAE